MRTGETQATQEQLLRALLHAAGVMRGELRRRLRALEVTPEEWLLLDGLWAGSARTQSALAELTGKEKSTVARLLYSLERKGLVERPAGGKQRSSLVLTRRGEELCKRAAAVAGGAILFATTGLEEGRMRTATAVLKWIAETAAGD